MDNVRFIRINLEDEENIDFFEHYPAALDNVRFILINSRFIELRTLFVTYELEITKYKSAANEGTIAFCIHLK